MQSTRNERTETKQTHRSSLRTWRNLRGLCGKSPYRRVRKAEAARSMQFQADPRRARELEFGKGCDGRFPGQKNSVRSQVLG